jgi:ABC-2 type transport system ATP-binding protein
MSSNIALEIRGISKTYKNKHLAVNNISFKVMKGDFFALLGPNGAGKSTLLGMISSLVTISSGDAYIFDSSITKSSQVAKSFLGFMPQEVNLSIFETPLQILLTQAGYYGISRAESYNYIIGLMHSMDLYSKRDKQVRFLSGGMKRRLMVARALVHKPKLLILDEPTAGVDVELRAALWSTIKELNNQGLTIILTTHYLEEAERMCNKIALINNGKLCISTKMSAFLKKVSKEVYIIDLYDHSEDLLSVFKNLDFEINIINSTSIKVTITVDKTLNNLFKFLLNANLEIIGVRKDLTKLERLFMDVASNEFIGSRL